MAKGSPGKKEGCLSKADFVQLLSHTLPLGESTASSNLRKGFEKCGLFPMNRQNVLHSLSTYARQGDVVKDFVGQVIRKHVEK